MDHIKMLLPEQLRSLIPPKATLTEQNLLDQTGKVFIVTGASSGIGAHLAAILFSKNAKVYMAARAEPKTQVIIASAKAAHPTSTGQLIYLHLDLNDLNSVRTAASTFLAQEERLDVLWNNAGVMVPPEGAKTEQGFEVQLGVNNIAPFLFTQLLTPLMIETAKTANKNSVRVIWVSSGAVALAPKPPKGLPIDFENMDYHIREGGLQKYGRSKAGNVLHAVEFARRYDTSGIISLAVNPGNLKTDLARTMPGYQKVVLNLLTHDAINGAYTELFAGLDPSITEANNGGWVAPFGRIQPARADLLEPLLGKKYWDWTEEQVKPFLSSEQTSPGQPNPETAVTAETAAVTAETAAVTAETVERP